MLSRVADSLFWIGRYAERLETNAHIIERHLDHSLEQSFISESMEIEWAALIKICGYEDEFRKTYQEANLNDYLYYLIFDKNNFNSVASLVDSVRFNLKNTRNIAPLELWEIWHDIDFLVKSFEFEKLQIMELASFLKQLRTYCLTATGIVDSLMSRDETYMFLKIGKWLERAEKTSLICKAMLELKITNNYTLTSNFALLLTNTFEEFNRKHRNRTDEEVLQFILTDDHCTKSVLYGINKIHKTILDLQNGLFETYTDEIFKQLFDLRNALKVDCTIYDLTERLDWVKNVHYQCINFGPTFSRTYYLTTPILVV